MDSPEERARRRREAQESMRPLAVAGGVAALLAVAGICALTFYLLGVFGGL